MFIFHVAAQVLEIFIVYNKVCKFDIEFLIIKTKMAVGKLEKSQI